MTLDDPELYYEPSKLVSFPTFHEPLDLNDREIKDFKVVTTIPSDFPEDLVNQPFTILLGAKIEPDYVSVSRLGLSSSSGTGHGISGK